jgi:hypothetical protein
VSGDEGVEGTRHVLGPRDERLDAGMWRMN